MLSTWNIRERAVFVGVVTVFALGIAAERYRQHWSTNVGKVSVRRTDAAIARTIYELRVWKISLAEPREQRDPE